MTSLPKQKIVKPTNIRGFDNGQIPKAALQECGLGSGLLLAQPAARAFKALIAFYKTHPDALEITATGCYRSYNDQVRLFRERFSETRIPGAVVKTFNGKRYWLKKGVAQAATPGRSNHGWGLAVDLALYRKGTKQPVTPQLVKLLISNAHQFGFCAELDNEPWHWVYFAGNTIPEKVLDFENGKTSLTWTKIEVVEKAPKDQKKKTSAKKVINHACTKVES